MHTYRLEHLSNPALLRNLSLLVSNERTSSALILAHIAEVDRRRLYLPAGYPSMFAYCVDELRLSEDAAYKRIQAARVAREFPRIFDALATGLINLNSVVLLAPHLTFANAEDLLKEAAGRRRSELEELIARRFPRSESLPLVHAIPSANRQPDVAASQQALGGDPALAETGLQEVTNVSSSDTKPAARQLEPLQPKVEPIAHQRFAIQLSVSSEARDKLEHAQSLLSHSIPSGDLAIVFERALDALIEKLERRKTGATRNPRSVQARALAARTIPAHVRRAVWKRDGGRCTFVGESGHRCDSRRFLEYDHVRPLALGGVPTVDGIRLRCRGHNQHEANLVFGAGFMENKRQNG